MKTQIRRTKGLLQEIDNSKNRIQKYDGNFTAKDLAKWFDDFDKMKKGKHKFIVYADYLLLFPDNIFLSYVNNKQAECLGSAEQIKRVIARAKILGVEIKNKKPIRKYGNDKIK